MKETWRFVFVRMLSRLERTTFALLVSVAILLSGSPAPAEVTALVGLGDSLSEGVQSADCSFLTQPHTYLNLVGRQMGADFPLPWIVTDPAGVVGGTVLRRRLLPYFSSTSLAVSGATVHSLLNNQAKAATVREIASETDLVLFPRTGSQMEIAETIAPELAICWIGNNDVLSAALAFYQYDASQMTPIEEFRSDMKEIAGRLAAVYGSFVFGNIPDVTNIGFLLNNQDLIRFLGSDYGLKDGDYTSIVVMFLIRLGLDDGSLLQDPNFVLDADEVKKIQERIAIFNQIIADAASGVGMPVVDVHELFQEMTMTPPVFFGIPILHTYLGGIFSLDGVHPSNIGHAMVANAFIDVINSGFGKAIPFLSQDMLENVFLADPFIDKNGNGKVRGRPGAGLLETLGPYLGISGDREEILAEGTNSLPDKASGRRFIERYLILKGKDPGEAAAWTRDDAIEAFKDIFGIKRESTLQERN